MALTKIDLSDNKVAPYCNLLHFLQVGGYMFTTTAIFFKHITLTVNRSQHTLSDK